MKKNSLTLILGGHSNRIALRRVSMILLFALFLITSCSDNDGSPSQNDKPACTISTETNTVNGRESATITYVLKYVVTHTYDAAGNQIAQTYTYDYTYSDGKKAHSTSNASFQFDDKGFMLRSLRQYASTDRDGKASSSSTNEDFTYENERLIKDAIQSTTDGVAKSYAISYEYNDAGKVVKYTSTYSNSTTTIQYNGDAVLKITNTDGAGNTSSPFVQYDAKGRLIKSIDTSGATPMKIVLNMIAKDRSQGKNDTLTISRITASATNTTQKATLTVMSIPHKKDYQIFLQRGQTFFTSTTIPELTRKRAMQQARLWKLLVLLSMFMITIPTGFQWVYRVKLWTQKVLSLQVQLRYMNI